MTIGGSADDDERMKRRRLAATASAFFDARERIAWCIVGTAVYHVGFTSAIHPKNLSALKPGVQQTSLPAERGASSEAIRPWMWNSGMIDRLRSSGVRASVVRTLRADAQTLRCESGTILGRDVVPDV